MELVVLSQSAPMLLCDVCPKPGNCCKDFSLFTSDGEITYWEDTWESDSRADLDKRSMPFVGGINRQFSVTDKDSPDFGRTYVSLYYSCSKLDDLGRCSIYETRPDLCRSFVPGSCPLCVFGKKEI